MQLANARTHTHARTHTRARTRTHAKGQFETLVKHWWHFGDKLPILGSEIKKIFHHVICRMFKRKNNNNNNNNKKQLPVHHLRYTIRTVFCSEFYISFHRVFVNSLILKPIIIDFFPSLPLYFFSFDVDTKALELYVWRKAFLKFFQSEVVIVWKQAKQRFYIVIMGFLKHHEAVERKPTLCPMQTAKPKRVCAAIRDTDTVLWRCLLFVVWFCKTHNYCVRISEGFDWIACSWSGLAQGIMPVFRVPSTMVVNEVEGGQINPQTKWVLIGPRQAKKCLRTCAKCAHSDHPAHAQNIIRVFAFHPHIL